MAIIKKEEALKYHTDNGTGKIEVVPTTPYSTQRDLALAYSPGVAEPCIEINKTPSDVYKYTAKGNLVAVISNGTAVLGLGDLGPEASKPVMEGKGLLFKIFADIDVFDIEISTNDIDKFVETVKEISPTFGGINLEDIKSPQCFEIEKRLKAELDIPVMHDDQHGTAIICAAGAINAAELVEKKLEDIKMVVSGAGASAMSCTRLMIALGVKPENIIMCDSKGVINSKRTDINTYKKDFVSKRKISTLTEAMIDADLFLGLSVKGTVTKDMVKSMADKPIIFAMANPDPEISPEDVFDVRKDAIMATGRSDYSNQVNNVLGFPFIFRGALDVRATAINEEMKKAAVYAIAALAKEDVPEEVNTAYNEKNISFGKDYIIPKPLDPRLITSVAPAVAKAAMESGIAKEPITDWKAYENELLNRLGNDNVLLRNIFKKAKTNPQKVVFGDADNYNVLKAAQIALNDGLARPIILLGNKKKICNIIEEFELDDLKDVEIIDPYEDSQKERRNRYADYLYKSRNRKGLGLREAHVQTFKNSYFGALMVEHGECDVFITGYATRYKNALKPIMEVIRCNDEVDHVAGMYIMMTKKGPLFFADTTVNVAPDTQSIIKTTLLTAHSVKRLNIEPKIALLSYSNFGSHRSKSPLVLSDAVKYLHKEHPELIVDGEMQANFALNTELRKKKFPFSKLGNSDVNTIIFPNLSSGNIAYKMIQDIGKVETLGPILMGTKRPVHIVQLESSVREIVNMVAIAVVDAQNPKGSIRF